jgi:hypothetical protein
MYTNNYIYDKISFYMCNIYYHHYANSCYHSSELLSINMLHTHKLQSKSQMGQLSCVLLVEDGILNLKAQKLRGHQFSIGTATCSLPLQCP